MQENHVCVKDYIPEETFHGVRLKLAERGSFWERKENRDHPELPIVLTSGTTTIYASVESFKECFRTIEMIKDEPKQYRCIKELIKLVGSKRVRFATKGQLFKEVDASYTDFFAVLEGPLNAPGSIQFGVAQYELKDYFVEENA